jgi:hypothetical protein
MNAHVREHIRRLVAAAPPLTPDQRVRLAILLRPDMPVGIRKDTRAGRRNAA